MLHNVSTKISCFWKTRLTLLLLNTLNCVNKCIGTYCVPFWVLYFYEVLMFFIIKNIKNKKYSWSIFRISTTSRLCPRTSTNIYSHHSCFKYMDAPYVCYGGTCVTNVIRTLTCLFCYIRWMTNQFHHKPIHTNLPCAHELVTNTWLLMINSDFSHRHALRMLS